MEQESLFSEIISAFTLMYKDQPELMGKLMLGERVDLGDGLTMALETTHPSLRWNTFNLNYQLEGEDIGDLDWTLGGYIKGCEDEVDDWRLFEAVVKRMEELFPSLVKRFCA